ncbi:MAG: relaxase domain-containing protein [Micrococcales bacterium]|nr:relaxase domain-containing protein [Micrococcales bacterium]
MAMNITVMRSVSYLLDTCQSVDGSTRGPAGYYLADGTWPGRWRGTGLEGLGLSEGARVGRAEAVALFHHFAHPITAAALGRTPAPGSQVVNGFDLTFRVPKSVSLVWAAADDQTRQAIWDVHGEAVGMALDWIERDVLRTRSGRDGVAVEATRGLVAAAFDHFESRDGDPHLHTHVAVANRVQRARDGAWRTIDGRALMQAGVAASELHENLLLDLLHERLGMTFAERPRPGISSRAVVADVVGVDPALIEAFSSRDRAVSKRLSELSAQWSAEHGGASPPRKVVDSLKRTAWASTRKAKKQSPDSLATLTRRWRSELADHGTDPGDLVAAAIGHPVHQVAVERIATDEAVLRDLARLVLAERASDYTGKVAPADVDDADVDAYLADLASDATTLGAALGAHVTGDLAAVVHDDLSARSATWTRAGAEAAADRLTRLLRTAPAQRERLRGAIADAALAMCVPLTTTRYRAPARATLSVAVAGESVFDSRSRAVFTSRRVLDAEARLQHAATTDLPTAESGALPRAELHEHLAAHVANRGRPLAPDQAAAVEHLACSPHRLTAVVGPAGTGKTTSLRALSSAWTTEHGPGNVLALAPSARAASVLRRELSGVDATTLAGFIAANTAPAKARRTAWIARCAAAHAQARTRTGRSRAAHRLAQAIADDASVTIRPGTLVIVDEAAMATTADLDLVLAEVDAAGARMVLVGDPGQLDAVGAGGVLGRLERTGNAAHLTSIFRFHEPWQADASRRLHAGDATVLWESDRDDADEDPATTYADAGWVHDGDAETMLEGAYRATQAALAAGRDAVLLVATNADLSDLNTRATLERRAAGLVDSSRLLRLRGTADAGVGDVLIARRNEARITDTEGLPLENGDLLRLVAVTEAGDGVCRRVTGAGEHHEHGEQITVPAAYLRADAELGYAHTAHRVQGITVDEAHLVIPDGAHMTRNLVYVAMTRARGPNHVWVALPDAEELRDEHTPVFAPDAEGRMRPVEHTAATVLARALSADTAATTAHETADAEHERTTSLRTLAAEHEHLAHLAAEPTLRAVLTDLHGPDYAEAYTSSEAWDALVASFTRAHALDPERTRRLLAIPHHRTTLPEQGELALFGNAPPRVRRTPTPTPPPAASPDATPEAAPGRQMVRPRRVDPNADDATEPGAGDATPPVDTDDPAASDSPGSRAGDAAADPGADAPDPARLAHWTLTQAIVHPHLAAGAGATWIGQTPPVRNGPPDVIDMAQQAEELIARRVEHLRAQVLSDVPPAWVHRLPSCPDVGLDPDAAAAWTEAATAVATYRDTFDVQGATPLGPEPVSEHQRRARAQVATRLAALTDAAPARAPRVAVWAPGVDPAADPARDWSAEPPEISAPSRREAFAACAWPADSSADEPETDADPFVDLGDGAGPVLWEPAYTLPAPRADPTTQSRPASVDPRKADRLAAVNAAAYAFWTDLAADSWVPDYLAARGLDGVEPAWAPAAWTQTCDHVRARGFTDDDLEQAGIATRSSRGTLIDRFRDRAAVPIHDAAGRIAGFTARANPACTDPGVPKYLNTPSTGLFDKSTLLAGLTPTTREALARGATAVIVEGAFDAAAVTTASNGEMIGVAPCGTALTPAQLATLADTRDAGLKGLVIGFDNDPAGHEAAARTWDLLSPATAATCTHARWDAAKDPADLAARAGTGAVVAAVTASPSLAATIVERNLGDVDLSTVEGRVWAARCVAASIIPTLDQTTIDQAGAAFARALVDAGQSEEAAAATWQIAHTEALVAHSLASDQAPANRHSGPREVDHHPEPAPAPQIS